MDNIIFQVRRTLTPLSVTDRLPPISAMIQLYNVFNHTQFDAVDTTARFNAQGAQVNHNFGRVTATREPRLMQLSLRLTF